MISVFITGGSGLIARYLTKEFASDVQYHVYPVVSTKNLDFSKEIYKGIANVTIVSREEFFQEQFQKNNLAEAYVVHTAFTRSNNGEEIAKSMQYAFQLFNNCKAHGVKGIVNFSSRSVYKEPKPGCLNDEDSEINTDSLIAVAKYGVEMLLKGMFDGTKVKYTSLRVASVNELKTDNNMVRPLNVFVDCVINGSAITVFNGNQIMSFVDPRDVAKAVRLLCSSEKEWKDIYNVGPSVDCTCRLIDMAERVVQIGNELGYPKVDINIIEKDITQTAGLNSNRLQNDVGYLPEITLDMMIRSLFEMKGKIR